MKQSRDLAILCPVTQPGDFQGRHRGAIMVIPLGVVRGSESLHLCPSWALEYSLIVIKTLP